jgi:replicative DNA helicase
MDSKLLQKLCDRIGGLANGAGELNTGFNDFDGVINGLKGGEVIVLGGAPSMGKTAFCCSIAKNLSVDNDIPVLYLSLGENDVNITSKIVSNLSQINIGKINNGELDKDEWKRLDMAIEKLRKAPLYIESKTCYFEDIEKDIRKSLEDNQCRLVIVDYFQMLCSSNKFSSREEELSYISRSFKKLALEFDVPIIIVSQLNGNIGNQSAKKSRGLKAIEENRPKLSDLQEYGSIVQDADIVCLIHRPECYIVYKEPVNEANVYGLGQIIIAKHRRCKDNQAVILRFYRQYSQFVSEEDVD